MIDLEEAIDIILNANPNKIITNADEFENFYGFCLARPEQIGRLRNGVIHTVIKSNGEISFYNPITNLTLLSKCISIKDDVKKILESKGKSNLFIDEIIYEKNTNFI